MLLARTYPAFRNGAAPFAVVDRMLDELATPVTAGSNAVAYDLIKTGEDSFRLELPVPGFAEADLDVVAKGRTLTVTARERARAEDETVLHQGVARDGFVRRFALGAHLEVASARLRDGLLAIELVREVPEALKPRTIAVDRAG